VQANNRFFQQGAVALDHIRFVSPDGALEVFGIKLVGVNAETGKKVLLSAALLLIFLLLSWGLRKLTGLFGGGKSRTAFWIRQGIHLFTALILIVGIASIWFDEPSRFATAAGLITAGVAFAMQRVITAMAGYLLILQGKTFNVGDRIVMGGVRGDVIALGFMQTRIMEMGQPPGAQSDDPAMWVKARQYTGRIVSVSNAKIFDEPVYNYTREFPYLWEEMTIPIPYRADWHVAERILLDAAERYTVKISQIGQQAIKEMERRYIMRATEMSPRVYLRMTDNWLELTVRFLAEDHRIRDLKDQMTRHVLEELDRAQIGIASATFDIVGLPPLRIERVPLHDQSAV
jgi:small-conductance mechanosensitive channel